MWCQKCGLQVDYWLAKRHADGFDYHPACLPKPKPIAVVIKKAELPPKLQRLVKSSRKGRQGWRKRHAEQLKQLARAR